MHVSVDTTAVIMTRDLFGRAVIAAPKKIATAKGSRERTMKRNKRYKENIYQRIMQLTGTKLGGGHNVPPEAKTLRYGVIDNTVVEVKSTLYGDTGSDYRVFAPNNDGMELWFGYGHEWRWHLSNVETRSLFWWLLWEWYAKARWFGLRRPIYYWALRKQVALYKKQPVEEPQFVENPPADNPVTHWSLSSFWPRRKA